MSANPLTPDTPGRLTREQQSALVERIKYWFRQPYPPWPEINKALNDLGAALAAEREPFPAADMTKRCVCGHTQDEHGNDGSGHCGATKECRAGGCKFFRLAAEGETPHPVCRCGHDFESHCNAACVQGCYRCDCATWSPAPSGETPRPPDARIAALEQQIREWSEADVACLEARTGSNFGTVAVSTFVDGPIPWTDTARYEAKAT